MRAALTAFLAAVLLVSTIGSGFATGRGGPSHHFGRSQHGSWNHFPQVHNHHGNGGWGNNGGWGHGGWGHHHPPKPICKIVIIKIPKWTYASFGRHHKPRVHYIIIKKIICRPPFSP